VRRGSWRCGRGSIAEAVAEAVNNFLSTRKGKKPKLNWVYMKCIAQIDFESIGFSATDHS